MSDFISWTCVMVNDGPGIIPEDIRLHLQYSACELVLNKQERMKIVGDGPCNGIIETEGKSYNVGGRSGIMFRTQVDSPTGEYFINFLLSEEDLKLGAKILMEYTEGKKMKTGMMDANIPIPPELYEFRNLKKNRLGKSLN